MSHQSIVVGNYVLASQLYFPFMACILVVRVFQLWSQQGKPLVAHGEARMSGRETCLDTVTKACFLVCLSP